MADQNEHPSKTRAAPPPFVGPPRAGALAPKTRADRPTLPPFSPPFVKRPSPIIPIPAEDRGASTSAAGRPAPPNTAAPGWLDEPNEPTSSAGIRNGAEIPPSAPAQGTTGIDWLDSPTTERPAAIPASHGSAEDIDDVFQWDPAEERGNTLDTPSTAATLDALKELEPWALPGAEPSNATSEEVAAVLERVAARIRSGDLFVPGASAVTTDEAVLAAVLAALLQRARG